jgi:RimJ/RimL family protein N-acetyltransferase
MDMRPLRVGDETVYAGFYTDPEMMTFIGDPIDSQQSLGSFERVLAQAAGALGPLVFVMQLRATGAIVGLCGCSRVSLREMRAEVGLMLKSEARGMGLAGEGLRGAISAIFAAYPSVRQVVGRCSSLNPRVERLVLDVGFQLEDSQAAAHGSLAMKQWLVQRASWMQAQTSAVQQGDPLCQT